MSTWKDLRPALPILIAASVMLSLAMGLRQSLGLFMPPLTKDIGITVSDFTLAIAVQNLAWGLLQPLAGAWAVRVGYRPLMLAGSLLYVLGLVLLATAHSLLGVLLGAGVAIGASMACTGSAMAMAVAVRRVSPALRSSVLGIVSAAGSLGALLAAPVGQALSQAHGWRFGLYGFIAMALLMLPAAWVAGRVDALPVPAGGAANQLNAREALATAMRNPVFVVMSLAYFVCGMQLVFLTTHLPSYLDICGMDPMLSAQALGMIGAFNVLSGLFFGWAGNRWSKQALLGILYMSRSLVLAWFFSAPPTPETTLAFAGMMGFLWLGVSPLIAGSVAEMFGLRWQAMIQGLAFSSHQIGSFVGAFGGGLVYDMFGSYDLAWRFGVGLGLAAGAAQLAFAVMRPPPPALAR